MPKSRGVPETRGRKGRRSRPGSARRAHTNPLTHHHDVLTEQAGVRPSKPTRSPPMTQTRMGGGRRSNTKSRGLQPLKLVFQSPGPSTISSEQAGQQTGFGFSPETAEKQRKAKKNKEKQIKTKKNKEKQRKNKEKHGKQRKTIKTIKTINP